LNKVIMLYSSREMSISAFSLSYTNSTSPVLFAAEVYYYLSKKNHGTDLIISYA
jgi:hypothetical protein